MDSFTSMSRKLSKTGLYNVSPGSIIYAELMAYAEGLDIYYNALDELLRECFVTTAEDCGLAMREKYLCKCNIYDTVEGRRKSIIAALSLCNTDYVRSGYQKVLDIFGIEGKFTEDFENGKIIFNCISSIPENKLEQIKEQFGAFMPCGLNLEFNIQN